MPSTYTPIATSTVVGSATATITFSSIPSTYTDLILVLNGATAGSIRDAIVRFNSDSGTNYSLTEIKGDGSSATSSRASNITSAFFGYNSAITTAFESVNIMHIQNYSNTTTYKTAIARANTISRYVSATVNLWRSTSAINTVAVTISGGNYAAGSMLTLYGVKSA